MIQLTDLSATVSLENITVLAEIKVENIRNGKRKLSPMNENF